MEICCMTLSFANVQGNLQLEVQILRDAMFLCLSLSQESSLASWHLLTLWSHQETSQRYILILLHYREGDFYMD